MKNEDMHGILTRSPSRELSSLETTEYLEFLCEKSRTRTLKRFTHDIWETTRSNRLKFTLTSDLPHNPCASFSANAHLFTPASLPLVMWRLRQACRENAPKTPAKNKNPKWRRSLTYHSVRENGDRFSFLPPKTVHKRSFVYMLHFRVGACCTSIPLQLFSHNYTQVTQRLNEYLF